MHLSAEQDETRKNTDPPFQTDGGPSLSSICALFAQPGGPASKTLSQVAVEQVVRTRARARRAFIGEAMREMIAGGMSSSTITTPTGISMFPGEQLRLSRRWAERRFSKLVHFDEPTTGLHPSDVEKLMAQLEALVEAGNTVIVVEHEMRVVAGSDWVIDIGPGAGEDGGKVVASGPPAELTQVGESCTASYLARFFE